MNENLLNLVSLLGDKWSVPVIAALKGDQVGFVELHRRVPGISSRMLSVTLRNLSSAGVASREVLSEVPPRVHYALTKDGAALLVKVASLGEWAQSVGLCNARTHARTQRESVSKPGQ